MNIWKNYPGWTNKIINKGQNIDEVTSLANNV